MYSLIQKNGKNHVRDVKETTETIGEEVNRMTNAEAKAKIKKLLMAEIDRLPTHYDIDIDEQVFTCTAEVNELLELNKIVSEAFEALEKQIPKMPNYEGDGYWDGELVYDTWICPNCGKYYEVYYDNYKYCPECGQAIDSSAIDWSDKDD